MTMKYPKTGPARTKLVEDTLANILSVFPHDPKTDRGKALIANFRDALNQLGASKLMYLNWSADPDATMDEETILDAVKKCRASHDAMRQMEGHDPIFQFFRNYLRRYIIENKMELRVMEGIYYAVSRRDKDGKPIIDEAFRDMAKIVVQHTNYAKGGPLIVQNFPGSKSGEVAIDAEQKWTEFGKAVRENPEGARIIEVMEKERLARAKEALQGGATVDAGGELKEAGDA